MRINKTILSLTVIFCSFLSASIYYTVDLYDSSVIPSESDFIQFGDYELNFYKDSINEFKEKINKDFFNNNKSLHYNNTELEKYNTNKENYHNNNSPKNINNAKNNTTEYNDKYSTILNNNDSVNKVDIFNTDFKNNSEINNDKKQQNKTSLDYTYNVQHNNNPMDDINNVKSSASGQYNNNIPNISPNSYYSINKLQNDNDNSLVKDNNIYSTNTNTLLDNDSNTSIKKEQTNNYKDYYYFIGEIVKLTNIVRKFDEEITNKKYLKTNNKIKEITQIFKDILSKITEDLYKSKIYMGKYKKRKLNSIISKAEYVIISASSYSNYLLKISIIALSFILLILLEIRLNRK